MRISDWSSDVCSSDLDILAERGRASTIIERIIDKLEGDAEVASVGFKRRRLIGVAVSYYRADFGGSGKERRSLGLNDAHIGVFGRAGILGGGKLHHLAFRDHGSRIGDDLERAQAFRLDHQPEGAAKQKIADQHTRLIAPEHPRGLLAAPQIALVHDIVMEQCGRVQKLDAGREFRSEENTSELQSLMRISYAV